MRRVPLILGLAGGLLPAIAGGCSVWEDRQPCPCYLDIDYSALVGSKAGEGSETVSLALYGEALCWSADHRLPECPVREEIMVGKERLDLVAIVHGPGWEGDLSSGTRIVYEPGNQIDSLWVHAESLDCTGEEAVCSIIPRKQFTTITFTDEEGGALCRRYNMVVRGRTCGFDAADLSALEGQYLYTVQEDDGSGRIRVRVPRQTDPSLALEFWDKHDHRLLLSSPIGLCLFDSGYDPQAEDLPDYDIRIDFRSALLYLRIPDWEEEAVYALFN